MPDAPPLHWYPSKVDWWMYPLLAVPFIGSVAAIVALASSGADPTPAIVPAVFVIAIFGGLVLPMRYAITDDELMIKHGLIIQHVKLAEIVEVYPTRNPLGSPALSLDRLAISTGKGIFKSVMISPEARLEFLMELGTKARLRRDGEKLVRV